MKFSCLHCGQSLSATEELKGALLECPNCSNVIEVPYFLPGENPGSIHSTPKAPALDAKGSQFRRNWKYGLILGILFSFGKIGWNSMQGRKDGFASGNEIPSHLSANEGGVTRADVEAVSSCMRLLSVSSNQDIRGWTEEERLALAIQPFARVDWSRCSPALRQAAHGMIELRGRPLSKSLFMRRLTAYYAEAGKVGLEMDKRFQWEGNW